MRASHLLVLFNILFSRKNKQFLADYDALCKSDPTYSMRSGLKLLLGLMRGEKIVRHKDVYVTNSHVPPLPTRALLTFLAGANDKTQPLSQLAIASRAAPLSTYICITNRCFYKCVHCSMEHRQDGDELSTSQWIQVVNDLQDLGVSNIGITGGEPLIRDDLEEILAAADDRSTLFLATNGKLLSYERAVSLVKRGLFGVVISLDSADPQRHDEIRGHAGAFQAVIEAIRNARRAGLYTIIQPVIFRNELSREHLLRLFRLVHRHGAHEVRVVTPIKAGRLLHVDNPAEVFYTAEDKRALVKLQQAVNRRWFGYPKVSSLAYTEGPDKFGCGAGQLHSYITSSGELTPCDTIPLSFGNVVTEDLAEVYGRMRDALKRPHMSCLAMRIAPLLEHRQLPLEFDESKAICERFPSTEYPKFFLDLQTLLDTTPPRDEVSPPASKPVCAA